MKIIKNMGSNENDEVSISRQTFVDSADKAVGGACPKKFPFSTSPSAVLISWPYKRSDLAATMSKCVL